MLPTEREPQSPIKGHFETHGAQCEEQSRPQPVPSSEAQPGIEDPLQTKSQPPAQPDPLTEQLKRVAKEAKNIVAVKAISKAIGKRGASTESKGKTHND